MTVPENPISAATHPDPRSYYTALAAEKPIYYDEAFHMWIATSAEAVTAVMNHDLCRVRPAAEPVPANLVGSTAGEIFGALVRMNDGEHHTPLKKAVSSALDSLDSAATFEISLHHAQMLAAKLLPKQLTDFTFALSAYVLADLLGVSAHYLSPVSWWMADFVRCLSPISTPEQIDKGKQAAEQLCNLFQFLLSQDQVSNAPTLLDQLAQALAEQGVTDTTVVIANAIGFISQSYEATAGLIGNALVTLAAHPDLHTRISTDLSLLPRFIDEVVRFDAPVQNTRRFLAADAIVAGQPMKAGDAVLVLLAAANTDPVANPHTTIFDLQRDNARCLTFGTGIHACPGQSLAKTITHAALHHLFTAGLDVTALHKAVSYRPSTNTRVPLLNHEEA